MRRYQTIKITTCPHCRKEIHREVQEFETNATKEQVRKMTPKGYKIKWIK